MESDDAVSGWKALDAGIALDDEAGVEALAERSRIEISESGVAIDGARGCSGFRTMIGDGTGDVFFECRRAGVTFFVAASEPDVDIDEPVQGTFFDVRDCFDRIVPLVAFLRRDFASAFGDPDVTGATLIVDDPSLKRRYGFLDFAQLEAAIERSSFSTTIAFIPWNCRRSHPAVARIAALL